MANLACSLVGRYEINIARMQSMKVCKTASAPHRPVCANRNIMSSALSIIHSYCTHFMLIPHRPMREWSQCKIMGDFCSRLKTEFWVKKERLKIHLYLAYFI